MAMRLDFTNKDYFRDSAARLEALRAAGPVVEVKFPIVGKVWVTTTYEAAGRVLKDNQTFTLRKDGGVVPGFRWWMPRIVGTLVNNMLTMDEPDHTRLRGIVDEAFRRRAILDMEPRILAIADKLADDLFAEGSPADLVDRYARRLPLAVICELLGLPQTDRAKFMAWANTAGRIRGPFSLLAGAAGVLRDEAISGGALADRARAWRRGADRRARPGGEGGWADQRRGDGGHGLSPAWRGVRNNHALISGSDLKNPSLRDWLEQDWARANLAVEEFLRFVSPVQFSKPRYVRKDFRLDGVELKKGDKIMVMIAPANADPRANEAPEKLDLERHPNRHVAFGTGIHFCLGFQLARLEGKCALKALFTR